MRTTLDIDDDLMERLLARFPETSKTKAVESAIDGFLRHEACQRILELEGQFPDLLDYSAENARLEEERFKRIWG